MRLGCLITVLLVFSQNALTQEKSLGDVAREARAPKHAAAQPAKVFSNEDAMDPSAIGQNTPPKEGFVPNAATAVKIAEAVLVPVYGKKAIESEKPFVAKLKSDVWTVSGTLRCPDGKGGTTTTCVGGAAEVKISKTDGRIIRLLHWK